MLRIVERTGLCVDTCVSKPEHLPCAQQPEAVQHRSLCGPQPVAIGMAENYARRKLHAPTNVLAVGRERAQNSLAA